MSDNEFPHNLFRANLELFEAALEEAFQQKKDFLIHELSQRLSDSQTLASSHVPGWGSGWIRVDSMYRLRKVVGGRFEGIKRRWAEAGFPLLPHKGSKHEEFDLNQSGWARLSSWLDKKGFESRLSEAGSEGLFEVRVLKRINEFK